jgi:hypothetical protein
MFKIPRFNNKTARYFVVKSIFIDISHYSRDTYFVARTADGDYSKYSTGSALLYINCISL